jgi:hypothetical protein
VKQSAVELTYSDKIPAPAYIYVAPDAGSGWQNIGASAFSAVFTISAKTSTLGYFAGGYTAGKPPPSSVQVGGGQALPIVVAAIIVLVLLGGVPLALRRRADGDGDDDGGRGDDPDPAEGGGGPDRGG